MATKTSRTAQHATHSGSGSCPMSFCRGFIHHPHKLTLELISFTGHVVSLRSDVNANLLVAGLRTAGIAYEVGGEGQVFRSSVNANSVTGNGQTAIIANRVVDKRVPVRGIDLTFVTKVDAGVCVALDHVFDEDIIGILVAQGDAI